MTEAIVLSELVKRDLPVLTPFGENHRYDFVVEFDEEFHRIQCKTARHKGDKLRFQVNSSSPSNTGQTKAAYKGDVDYFIVHSRELAETYLVPIDAVGVSTKTLRLERPRNNQSEGIDVAADYTLDTQLETIRQFGSGASG